MASMSLRLRNVKIMLQQINDLSLLSKIRSIIFEKQTGIFGPADANALVTATQSASKKLNPVVDMNGADSFLVLVQLLRVAKKEDILSAFNEITSDSERKNTEVSEYVVTTMKIQFKIILKRLNLCCDTLIILL